MENVRKILFIFVCLAMVCFSTSAFANEWKIPDDFATIQDAVDDSAVVDGDTLLLLPGNHLGAYVSKSLTIRGKGKAFINDGPELVPYGLFMGIRFQAGGDNSKIYNITFTTDFGIMTDGSVDGVVIIRNKFLNNIQAVSCWMGSGWFISENRINGLRTQNGGGIGILVGNREGGDIFGNIVVNNTILGTLSVWDQDGGGYDGTGIALYSDYRWDRLGGPLFYNYVARNRICLKSDNPNVVDVNAIELTDTRDDTSADPYPVIYGNTISKNNLACMKNKIVLTPANLDEYNNIFGKKHFRPKKWFKRKHFWPKEWDK